MDSFRLVERLEKLPLELWEVLIEMSDKDLQFQKSQAEYENSMDKVYLKAKAEFPDMTVKELEATARNENYVKRQNLILAEANLKLLKNKADCIKSELSAMQSISKLKTAEISQGA